MKIAAAANRMRASGTRFAAASPNRTTGTFAAIMPSVVPKATSASAP